MNIKDKVNFLLDFILPRDKTEKLLDKMDSCTFSLKAKSCHNDAKDIFAIFEYRDPLVKRLIWLIKFKGDRKRSRLVSELMHDHIVDTIQELSIFGDFQKPVIIPVPLAEKKLEERGFNQCELIAEKLSEIDGNQNFDVCYDAVKKIRETESQSGIKNKIERTKNISGCFLITNKKAIRGKNIIIIDDVFTTGATINEIKKVLLETGAKKVIGFAFAH